MYEISHAYRAALGPSGLPTELMRYGGRFQRPMSSQWRMKDDELEAVQAQVAAWRAGQ